MSKSFKPPINKINFVGLVIVPIIALIGVPYYGYKIGYNAFDWMCCIIFIILCGISITAGYHRLWAHKTYKGNALYRFFWVYWGTCAAQNTVLEWASDHRNHHKNVDIIDKDPYCIKQGFFFAHMGWILRDYGKNDFSNVEDLKKEKIIMWQYNNYFKILLFSNVLIPLILGYINFQFFGGSFFGVIMLAGLLRFVYNHHGTFLINSACHCFGSRPYSIQNTSRDNLFLALITFGEGYHNYHHTFQSDYRNGHLSWHYDPTKWLIYFSSLLGITFDLKTASDKQILKQKELTKIEKLRDRVYGKINILSNSEKFEKFEKIYNDCKDALNKWIISQQTLFNNIKRNNISVDKIDIAKQNIKKLHKKFLEKKNEYKLIKDEVFI